MKTLTDDALLHSAIAPAVRRAERAGMCLVPATRSERTNYAREAKYGMLTSPMKQMYARTSYWETLEPKERAMHCMRSLQKMHPTWVFAGPSAALVYGLEVPDADVWPLRVAILRGENAYSSREMIRMTVDDNTAVLVDRLRVTSLERTVFDCLREMSFADGLAVADSALALGQITKEELIYRIDGFRKTSRGGRHAMETLRYADAHAQGAVESFARAAVIELGFVEPFTHVDIPCADGSTVQGALGWRNADGSMVLVSPDESLDAGTWTREDVASGAGSPAIRLGRFSPVCLEDREAFANMLDDLGVARLPGGPTVGKEKIYTPAVLQVEESAS